ncbi:MAG: nucleotide exchange factor GrpE [Desulfotomaculaceae bacterium]|nr:nucleotide exchange factor GrpE [Desulfotomaculaceae bacterium]
MGTNNEEEKDLERLNNDGTVSVSAQDEPGLAAGAESRGAAEGPHGEAAGAGDAGRDDAVDSDPVVLSKLLAEQTKRADQNYDRLIRLQADYDNFRRRTRQEKEDIYKYSSEQLITAILPVLDNFDLALSAEGNTVESFKAGMQMIYKQLLDVLAAEGFAQIPAVGEQFDPEKHEAVQRAESAEHPDNTIIEEFRRGYYLKDKVIRASMVKVVKS